MENSFLSRWSKRKLSNESDEAQQVEASELSEQEEQSLAENALNTEDDLSSEALPVQSSEPKGSDETSVAALIASEAESAIKKAALRKLFLSGEFSEIDRLNDYDHDYKSVQSLSSEAAAKLRDWMNQPEEEAEQERPPEPAEVETTESDAQTEECQDEADVSDEMGQNIPQQK